MTLRGTSSHYIGTALAKGLFILFSLAALAFSVWQGPVLLAGLADMPPLAIASLAVTLYAASHILRIFRLWCMLVANIASFRALAALHLHTAWATAILPFKTGEVLRASELMRLSRDPYVGLAAFALEKIFDAVILLSFALLASAGGIVSSDFRFFTLLVACVTAAAIVLWLTIPGTLFYARELLLTHSRSPHGLVYIKAIDTIERFYDLVRSVLKFRIGLIVMLSLLSWVVDFMSFACLSAALGKGIPALAKLFIKSHQEFATILSPAANTTSTTPYNAMVILFLTLVGVPSMIVSFYGWRRMKRRRMKPYTLLAPDHAA